jgi:hypothetical protein
MSEHQMLYAVYFHPNALEALGEAIKPFLTQGANGPHIVCSDIDTGGALCEMTVEQKTPEGRKIETEVMVPVGMIRLVVSLGGDDGTFGFAVD